MSKRTFIPALVAIALLLPGCDLIESLLGGFSVQVQAESPQAFSDQPVEFHAVVSPAPGPSDYYSFQWTVNGVPIQGLSAPDIWYKGIAAFDRTVVISAMATNSKGKTADSGFTLTLKAGGSLRLFNSWAPTYSLRFYNDFHDMAGLETITGAAIPVSTEAIFYGIPSGISRHLAVSVYDPYNGGASNTIFTWTANFDQSTINTLYSSGSPKYAVIGWSEPSQRYNDGARAGSDTQTDRTGGLATKPLAYRYAF